MSLQVSSRTLLHWDMLLDALTAEEGFMRTTLKINWPLTSHVKRSPKFSDLHDVKLSEFHILSFDRHVLNRH